MRRGMGKKVTRREIIKWSSGLAACASSLSPALSRSAFGSTSSGATAEEPSPVYKVVRPTGDVTVRMITQAPRLGTLDGKTICIVINGSFKSVVTAPLIETLLRNKYPSAKIIPYTEMPRAQKAPAPGTTTKETDALMAALKEKGCQAIISGNGG